MMIRTHISPKTLRFYLRQTEGLHLVFNTLLLCTFNVFFACSTFAINKCATSAQMVHSLHGNFMTFLPPHREIEFIFFGLFANRIRKINGEIRIPSGSKSILYVVAVDSQFASFSFLTIHVQISVKNKVKG